MDKIFGLVDFSKDFFSLTDSHESVEVLFQGSIYNRDFFESSCQVSTEVDDTVLMCKAFEIFGIELFSKIDGIFTMVLYDRDKEMLYLVRDRAGIRPLYFYDFNQNFIFGSKLKDFYTLPTFTKKIDKEALAVYLSYGYLLQPYTIFEHTYKVKSGHYVVLDIKKRVWQQKSYWSLESCYSEPKPNLTEQEILKTVPEILQKAIEKRLDKDTNIAATLSGGYDSSIVTALLSQHSDKKIDTFTIGFSQKEINEAPFAKKIASYLNTDHNEHYFSDEDAVRIVPKLCEVYDEPFADYGATPTVLMAELVKEQGFSKLFIGDGGDEVFATADDVSQFENILKTPLVLRRGAFYLLDIFNPSKIVLLKDYQNFPTKYYKFLHLLKGANIPQMVKIKPILFIEDEIKKLLNIDKISLHTTFEEISFPLHAQAVDQVIGSYFKTSMVDAELVKSFQASRAVNISLKEPLLDNELISYMAKVPQDIKIKNGEKKYVLKQIAHTLIPKKLLDRPKSGFDIPFSLWLKGPLKELVYAQINKKRLDDDGIFNTQTMLLIRDSFYSGNDAYKYKLWTLFLFQLWYENVKD